jgi:hypothetical protein
MLSKEEIGVADFINLANQCVGTGLFNTGEKYFHLAIQYANQEKKKEAIGFHLWTQRGECEWTLNDEDEWYKYPDTENRITTEQLYQLYIQSKNTTINE